jgi:hypothetical protein
MDWLWIILRALFPRDPIRQGAEAIRQRVVQLMNIANADNWLQELLTDPAIRLQIELIILDAEDTLRLWIAMRGCQIAGVRLGVPHERAIPNLTRAKDLPELLARIYELLEACEKMEQRAQAHADRLKRLRDADPLAAHGSPDTWNGAWLRHAAQHEAVPTSLASTLVRGPPHSIAGANP